jgi:hypothetical protein
MLAGHEECALRATLSLLQARIEHDRARQSLFRSALRSGLGRELPREVVELARAELVENHRKPHKPSRV